ncbi:MAG: hypothetical protein QM607_10095 [Microbacterium sp.]
MHTRLARPLGIVGMLTLAGCNAADTDEAATRDIAAALLARNPDLTGIYVPWATAGTYGVLGKEAPALVASAPIAVTADNVAEAWQEDYGTEPPASVTDAR